MADSKTLAVYAARTKDYANLPDVHLADGWLNDFIALMPPQAHVLDLGCGPGHASAHMRDKGLIPDPVDAAPEMIAIAQDLHGLSARLASFDDISAEHAYDGVWAHYSLLHAPKANFARHLLQLHRALKPRGILHLGLKEGTGESRDRLGRFYSYYTVDELNQLLSAAGFTVTTCTTQRGRGLAGTNDTGILMRAHA